MRLNGSVFGEWEICTEAISKKIDHHSKSPSLKMDISELSRRSNPSI